MYKTKNTVEQHIIYGAISDGTFANYCLMKEEFRRQDDDWIKNYETKWTQLKFNTDFLQKKLATYGALHCEYCGKNNLVIYPWNEKADRSNMATTDHFIPKSTDPHRLSYDINNLVVACWACNNKKANHVWTKDTLKYKYTT